MFLPYNRWRQLLKSLSNQQVTESTDRLVPLHTNLLPTAATKPATSSSTNGRRTRSRSLQHDHLMLSANLSRPPEACRVTSVRPQAGHAGTMQKSRGRSHLVSANLKGRPSEGYPSDAWSCAPILRGHSGLASAATDLLSLPPHSGSLRLLELGAAIISTQSSRV